jgi:DNA-binding MarR family transcriptional regulator
MARPSGVAPSATPSPAATAGAASEANAPILRLIGLVARQLADELQAEMAGVGFDDTRFAHNAVFANVPPEGIRLTDLAERAGMSKQAMSELVADLEQLGYVRRVPDPVDRRAKIIEFTGRGWQAVDAALAAFGRMEDALDEQVGPGRMNQLRRTLLAILAE